MKISDFKDMSATDAVQAAIARAKECAEYNALLVILEEQALARAAEIDEKRARGENVGRLAGVPFVAKDNFLMANGAPTTASSHILENFVSPITATAVERLEQEGAICIGKANLDAFAHGGSTENSAFGVTKNAFDMERVAGGSSGGSAVSVALDIVPFAIGSDTGGSIRQPASYNGVIGVKPTYGAVSRYGVVAMASSTDTIGVFTKNASDASLLMNVMAGRDEKDMTTIDGAYGTIPAAKPLTIGLIQETMADDVDDDVRTAVNDYAERLRAAGHTVKEVSLPMSNYSLAMYYIIVPAEVCSNLARYDGIRYGHRAKDAKSLLDVYTHSRKEGFEAENKRRIMTGSYVLSSGFYDAYYQKAQKARTLLIAEYETLFETCDVLLTPTAPTAAFKIGANTDDPVKMYLADIMTVPASLAGLPAINVPAGKTAEELPIGAQLIGPQKSDELLLQLAGEGEK